MTSKLNAELLKDTMRKPLNIRNISVIAHVDHGKSTLTDSLVSRAGLIPENQAGEKRFTDGREDEQKRGITIKSTSVSMLFEMDENILGDLNRDGDGFLVNLIDSPGHVDFSSEVTAALRVTDGALVVVDVVSGCSVQTETVLRQALSEKIKPVLVINKIDRAILEQKLEPERLYQRLNEIIEKVNYLIYVYGDKGGDSKASGACETLDPVKGNVAFAAGKDGWAFTLTQFAQFYNKKKGTSSTSSFQHKLWGDNFYNSNTKKWQTTGNDLLTMEEKVVDRGFNKFILDPIYKALHVCLDNDYDKLENICEKLDLDIKLKIEQREKFQGRDLMKYFMKKWLPAAEAMLELIVLHLPSPLVAQRYRVNELYEGPLDDEAALAIRECDSSSHLMIYISKMLPSSVDKNRFFAFGRVFSGTASVGQKVRIMGPDYKIGTDDDLYVKSLTRCMVMIGDQPLSVGSVPAGNIIALDGIDKTLTKSGTISTYKYAHNIKTMKFSVSAIVRVAVEPVHAGDLTKLIDGLKRLSKSDPLIKIESDKGQHIISGAGELHLEICLKDLQDYAGVELRTSDPLVTYKETVVDKSSQTCLAKSGNKHNRIFMTSEPLSEEFCSDVDNGKIYLNQDKKQQGRYLHETHGFELSEAKKIWCFGPNQFDSNILIDMTKGVASSGDVTDTLCAGFQWGSEEGVLCQENLRGVRFNIEDLMYHSDPAHRKTDQLLPTMRRAMMASMLTAQPRLVEPVYLVEIQCPSTSIGAIYTMINTKRGEIIEEQMITGSLLYNLKAYLPVNESTGFTGDLRRATSGKAFPQCSFHHWQLLPGDPLDVQTIAGKICKEIRIQKGLSQNVPTLDYYLDKL